MRMLCRTSLLQLLTYKSNSVYAPDKQTGIPTSNMCQRHVHICTLQARWMTLVSLTVSWNTWRGVLRTPFIILLLLILRFLNLNPPHNALAQTHNTSPIPHNHRASLLAAIPTATGDHYYQPDRHEFHQQIFRVELALSDTIIHARSHTHAE